VTASPRGLTGRESWLVAISWIEGNVVAHRSDVLKIICARDDPHPTPEQIAEVWCCSNRETLIRWFDRCLTATNADEVLAD
jgi:hypothetical protein